MKLALLGRTHWLLAVAEQCLADGHTFSLVATTSPSPEYRVKEDDFARFAEKVGASFFFEPQINSDAFINILRTSGADLGVSINWPSLLGPEACSALPKGIINAHAGDLPRYRGNACSNWAILNGESHIGLCIHAMKPGDVDAGPIFARSRLNLNDDVYIGDVYDWLDNVLPGLFVEGLRNVATADFVPVDQATCGITPLRCHPRRPEDGLIDWAAPARHVQRLVRASSRPFAGAYSFLEGETKVIVWRARVTQIAHEISAVPGQIMGRGTNSGVLVACGEGILEIEEAELADGRALPAANRYRMKRANSG